MTEAITLRTSTTGLGLPAPLADAITRRLVDPSGHVPANGPDGFIVVPAVTTGPDAQRRPQTILMVQTTQGGGYRVLEALTSNSTSVSSVSFADTRITGDDGRTQPLGPQTLSSTSTMDNVTALLARSEIAYALNPSRLLKKA